MSRRTFSYACVAAAAVGIFYLTKEKWYPRSLNLTSETSDSNLLTGDREAAANASETKTLPPGQHEIRSILRWNIDHPGITPQNPKLDQGSWRLTVEGEIRDPQIFMWRDFLSLESLESVSDFHCVEGWTVRNCRWYGVPFRVLVDHVKPTSDGRYVYFTCADGYSTSLELTDLLKENVLLAYRLDDQPLEESLGGPMRLVVPDNYAYKSAMWIQKIVFTKNRRQGFWESQGYSETADVWRGDRFAR
ncbi:molybdopterin-dependent oxidoreductase [Candidatus Bathyarchaeota archaeon]|nr:molybdopterin-dependent oxidoreductase [Candidatus Bathyarchaeota archaeon]